MFKNAGSLIFNKQFKKILKENENFKKFFCNRRNDTLGQSLFSTKVNPSSDVLLCKKAFHNNKNNYVKPVILFSGILTYLGLKEKTPEEKENDLIMAMKTGVLYTQREQYDAAEQVLHYALKLAQDQNDEDGITYVFDLLANLAFQRHQYDKSEKLFVGVLQRLFSKGEEEDSNKVIEISLKLAKIFELTKRNQKAEMGYKFCLDSLNKKLESEEEDTLALWGMSMDWYAKYLLGINKTTEALECLKKAYEMCVKVNGVEHEQSVVLLNDLGTISSLVGDTESAMAYFQEAKNVGEKLPEMKDLAAIYINLGHLYLLREMYKESKLACEEGLRKAKDYEDSDACSEAQQCLDNINKAMQTKGKEVNSNKKK